MDKNTIQIIKEKLLKVSTKEDLIKLHIFVESIVQKKDIDKNHTNLFRGYNTLIGYKNRIKKYYNSDNIFPYGTSILFVCLIMHYLQNKELALMEAEIVCKHPQTLIACKAIIKLYETEDMKVVKDIIKKDDLLLSTCEPCKCNILFLPQWCKHYFMATIYGFHGWSIENFITSDILTTIYYINKDHFLKTNHLL